MKNWVGGEEHHEDAEDKRRLGVAGSNRGRGRDNVQRREQDQFHVQRQRLRKKPQGHGGLQLILGTTSTTLCFPPEAKV